MTEAGYVYMTCIYKLNRFATSERQWVEAQVENAKQQAILSMLKSQISSDEAHIHRDIHSLRYSFHESLAYAFLSFCLVFFKILLGKKEGVWVTVFVTQILVISYYLLLIVFQYTIQYLLLDIQ